MANRSSLISPRNELPNVLQEVSMITDSAAHGEMTAGDVFRLFRRLPEMRKLVEDCYYDEDLLGAAERFFRSEEFSTVLGYISSGTREAPAIVLDLGGGNGAASLAYHRAGFEAILVEPDDDEVVGTGAVAPFLRGGEFRVRICKAVGERLPFAKETFDIAYSRSVLHHVRDLNTVCAEVHRVLKPGGVFIATREHVISGEDDLAVFLRNHPVHKYTAGENAFVLKRYRDAIRNAGFAKLEVLGPWESTINYYPMSTSQFIEQCSAALGRLLGHRLGRYLADRHIVSSLCGWYLTRRDRTPGRLYSFVAIR